MNTMKPLVHMIRRLTKWLWLALFGFSSTVSGSERITVIYDEQPPYIIHGSWGPYGLVGDAARTISIKTSLEFQWEKVSAPRQANILKKNPANTCILGVGKTGNWTGLGVYTLPVYQEKDYYLFARGDDPFFNSKLTAKEILTNRDRTLILVKRYPYQERLQRLVEAFNPPSITIRAQAEFAFIALVEGRGDYIFLTESEALYLTHLSKRPMEQFNILKLQDLPPGRQQYFLCTKATEQSIVNALNQAISEVRMVIESAEDK